MRPSLPLSVQLLLTFVGLLMGTTAVLTTVAYRSSQASLEAEAHRNAGLVTRSREQALTQLFHLRQQRAEGFLTSAESLCSEMASPPRRLAWVGDCVRTMVGDFRRSERAIGALLTYRGRRISRSGRPVSAAAIPAGSLARIIRGADGAIEYAMQATRGDTTLALQFDHEQVADLFKDQAGLGRSGEVFLIHYDGQFLTRTLDTPAALPADRAAAFLQNCRTGTDGLVALDYRGIRAIQSFVPIRALGTACAAARIGYDEALAPAERLRGDLVSRGAWFVVIGAVLSLVAAQWISAPVRRLAVSARKLQDGEFDRPIPLAGPSEVRALGRAFNAMGNNLAEVLAKEQTARREAEDANRSKDEFLATVSHELRTPLTAILGWAQMLRTERLPVDRVQHAIEVIERSARAQAQLIDDLLDVTRIVSNRLRIAREPVRLTEIIDAALDAVRPQAAAKHVEIETFLSEPAMVLGDPRRLEQIVWNLAWNAIKFTPESGRVRVELARTDRQAILTVSDTGVGISSTFIPHVFEWFRQADARSRSQSGLGLGLGIVRHLVQLHGGTVHAESAGAGQGATFVVTLPLHEPATPVRSASPGAELPPPPIKNRLHAVRVLVVEDDADTRELVRATLENAGASVEVVASAQEARRELLADTPDVLISDIRMPEEDGYSLMQSLRSAGVVMPAIALTAYARIEDADQARAAGFQIHLPKPVDAVRLVDAVAKLLENHTVH
jgi:signal transduction histidine kinase/ActR/RegA family two-component response regulator